MTQVRAMETTQQSRDKEVISLRQQLIDFQAQSDEKTVIGWHMCMHLCVYACGYILVCVCVCVYVYVYVCELCT